MGPAHRRRRLLAAFTIAASAVALALVPVTPGAAHGSGPESLYPAGDPYLDRRVQEVTDTADVLLAVQWRTTVPGTVNGIRICLDLTYDEVNSRLPLTGSLWTADGTTLATGGASEAIERFAPCFYQLSMNPTRVEAGRTYVVGFWLRGGRYSYVPHGFDEERSTASGHLSAWTSRYVYTSSFWNGSPFPTENWADADYLVTPAFTPDPH
ncbi:hypothetical protein Val02_21910 [Virgisporangium aliadipatigenens]|uniref:DUF4082 domain-containing protein n=1 Tax=Virgisporangium aliadipatigenens TaxID=741659 RepID=A0A8J3YJS0_9ACTN|nr:DUF4082 domain-containing protein [Virgisporangium aliadipatigenens]GIJ45305.1 hypothetical protein Val02_21910 [Virgisporangium aliadipatigenens]